MIKDLLNKAKAALVEDQPEDAQEPQQQQPAEPPKDSPRATTVAGYTQGDEVTAVVSRKECPHPKMLFISVPDWEGAAVTYVQDKRDWRTGDRMKVRFARMRPDYVLEFDGPKGPHRNKFGRRG